MWERHITQEEFWANYGANMDTNIDCNTCKMLWLKLIFQFRVSGQYAKYWENLRWLSEFLPGEPKNRHLGYNILNNKMHNMFLNIFDKAYKSNSFGQCWKDQCEGESIWRWKNFERNWKWFFWVMKRWELIERWQLKSFLTSWDGERAWPALHVAVSHQNSNAIFDRTKVKNEHKIFISTPI